MKLSLKLASAVAAAIFTLLALASPAHATDYNAETRVSVNVGFIGYQGRTEAHLVTYKGKLLANGVGGAGKVSFIDPNTMVVSYEVSIPIDGNHFAAPITDGNSLFYTYQPAWAGSTYLIKYLEATKTFTSPVLICDEAGYDVGIANGGKLYIPCTGSLAVVNPSNMAVERRFSFAGHGVQPAVTQDAIWIPVHDANVLKFDLVSGQQLSSTGNCNLSQAAYATETRIFCVDLHYISWYATDGSYLGSINTPWDGMGTYYRSEDATGVWLCNMTNSTISHFNFSTLTFDQSVNTSGYSTGSLVDGGALFVATGDGKVTRYGSYTPNLAESPTPGIVGTAATGNTLTVVTGSWDAGVDLAYAWLRDDAEIDGANQTSYQLTPADVGHSISIRVIGSKTGFQSATRTSDAVLAGEGSLTLTPKPTFTGSANTGQTLTALAGEWDAGVDLEYAWLRDGAVIMNATSASYKLTSEDYLHSISVSVTGARAGYTSVTKVSDSSDVQQGDFSSSSVPSISGVAKTARTLTVVTGSWDALAELSFTWLRDGAPIFGANESTYLVSPEDFKHQISVRVTGTHPGYRSVDETSLASEITAGDLVLTPTPSISGLPRTGQTLKAIAGSWDPGTDLVFAWFRDDKVIGGSNSSEYTLTSADYDHKISVRISASKYGFVSVDKTSAGLDVLAGSLSLTPTPTMSGLAKTGQTLVASPGTWDAGVQFRYRWLRDGQAIEGALASEYTLTDLDYAHQITLEVQGVSLGFDSVIRTSSPLVPGLGDLDLTSIPTVSGTPKTGSTLSVSVGSWTNGVQFSYSWLRDGSIFGATNNSTYVLQADDVGHQISVRLTGSLAGYSSVEKQSAAVTVTKADLLLTPNPSVNGVAKTGSELSVDAGQWDEGVSLEFTWLRDGNPIDGANKATYMLTSADYNHRVSVQVSASKPGFNSAAKSNTGSQIALGTLTSTPTPEIVGSAKVGLSLTAFTGTWDSCAHFTYQWLRDGGLIGAGKSDTYVLTSADFGKLLSVEVTVDCAGYQSVTKESLAVSVSAGTMTKTGTVTVNGTAAVGSTLTALPGNWDAGTTFEYLWLRDGQPIASARESSYLITSQDLARQLSVEITGSNFGYRSAIANSINVAVSQGVFPAFTVSLSGTLKVGKTLTAGVKGLLSGAKVTYQWLRDGKAISRATSAKYKLASTMKGHKVSVRVTQSADGFVSKTVLSKISKVG